LARSSWASNSVTRFPNSSRDVRIREESEYRDRRTLTPFEVRAAFRCLPLKRRGIIDSTSRFIDSNLPHSPFLPCILHRARGSYVRLAGTSACANPVSPSVNYTNFLVPSLQFRVLLRECTIRIPALRRAFSAQRLRVVNFRRFPPYRVPDLARRCGNLTSVPSSRLQFIAREESPNAARPHSALNFAQYVDHAIDLSAKRNVRRFLRSNDHKSIYIYIYIYIHTYPCTRNT